MPPQAAKVCGGFYFIFRTFAKTLLLQTYSNFFLIYMETMRRVYYYFIAAIIIILLLGCKKESIEPDPSLVGKWIALNPGQKWFVVHSQYPDIGFDSEDNPYFTRTGENTCTGYEVLRVFIPRDTFVLVPVKYSFALKDYDARNENYRFDSLFLENTQLGYKRTFIRTNQ